MCNDLKVVSDYKRLLHVQTLAMHCRESVCVCVCVCVITSFLMESRLKKYQVKKQINDDILWKMWGGVGKCHRRRLMKGNKLDKLFKGCH